MTPKEIGRGKSRFDQLASMNYPEGIPVGDTSDYDKLGGPEEREEGFHIPKHR